MATDEQGRFNTHLLSLEEVWYAREHPKLHAVVALCRIVEEVEALELVLEAKHAELERATKQMNARRNAKGWGNK